MVNPGERTYPSKLLLFGEYTVLSGGQALAVPLPMFKGRLVFDPELSLKQAENWEEFLHFLDPGSNGATGVYEPVVSGIRNELPEGLAFSSDIPVGYGVGSSGALVAALYRRYLPDEEDLQVLQQRLAGMESFFHGSSSGMDPLVSLTGKALLRSLDSYTNVVVPGLPYRVFLIDSGKSRDTQSLVADFKSSCQDRSFVTRMLRPLISHSDHAIHWLLLRQWDRLWEHISAISALQWEGLQQMIIPGIRSVWEASLQREDVHIKLCGAGGGGYYLGFAKGKNDMDEFFKAYNIPIINVDL